MYGSCSSVPRVMPTSTPLIPPHPTQELVIFVGYPSLGKTSFYRKHFEPAGYVHINQDMLRTREKCVKAAAETLLEGKSCVVGMLATPRILVLPCFDQHVDNTNRNAETRKYYVELAKKHTIPVRYVSSGRQMPNHD